MTGQDCTSLHWIPYILDRRQLTLAHQATFQIGRQFRFPWVNVSEGFRAKNVLSPSSLPFHCRSWEQVFFATFDRPLLSLLNWNSLTQTETIVVNFIQQEVQWKVVPRSCQLECDQEKRTFEADKKKERKKKEKINTRGRVRTTDRPIGNR